MAKITKVPNGPLIKKKGPYAGSTLKSGGPIKKAQNGIDSLKNANLSNMEKQLQKQSIAKANNNKEIIKKLTDRANKKLIDKLPKNKSGGMIKRAQNGDTTTVKKSKVDGFFKNIDKKQIKNSDTTGFYKYKVDKSKIIDDGFFKGPKVKSTGVISGHDYHYDCGVYPAVNEFFGQEKISVIGACWIYDKSK
jgi:hypothetical protein